MTEKQTVQLDKQYLPFVQNMVGELKMLLFQVLAETNTLLTMDRNISRNSLIINIFYSSVSFLELTMAATYLFCTSVV